MREHRLNPVILMAEDDEDDCLLAKSALEEAGMPCELQMAGDGIELMDHLLACRQNRSCPERPHPDLILLDLNMPRKDGREALREIKADSVLRKIPVVILSTSKEERDIILCNRLGAASFITKPVTFEEWIDMAKSLSAYLPGQGTSSDEAAE